MKKLNKIKENPQKVRKYSFALRFFEIEISIPWQILSILPTFPVNQRRNGGETAAGRRLRKTTTDVLSTLNNFVRKFLNKIFFENFLPKFFRNFVRSFLPKFCSKFFPKFCSELKNFSVSKFFFSFVWMAEKFFWFSFWFSSWLTCCKAPTLTLLQSINFDCYKGLSLVLLQSTYFDFVEKHLLWVVTKHLLWLCWKGLSLVLLQSTYSEFVEKYLRWVCYKGLSLLALLKSTYSEFVTDGLSLALLKSTYSSLLQRTQFGFVEKHLLWVCCKASTLTVTNYSV